MARKDIPLYTIDKLSEFRQKDILISRFAPYLESHENLHLAHKHSFYHLILFTRGRGYHTIDFTRFPVKPYQIYFMIPGQVHSWAFEGVVDGYVINFSPEFFQSFLLKPDYLDQFYFLAGNSTDSVIDLPKAIRGEIESHFRRLLGEMERAPAFAAEMIRSIILQIFFGIARLRQTTTENRTASHNTILLKNFQKNIELHFETMRLPKEYAELMYITPNHLNALCRDLLGIPAGELIRNRIVLEAKRQLVNLDLSVSEIAARLHFDDNSYFSKFFRKQAGLTPEEFRRQALQLPKGKKQKGPKNQ